MFIDYLLRDRYTLLGMWVIIMNMTMRQKCHLPSQNLNSRRPQSTCKEMPFSSHLCKFTPTHTSSLSPRLLLHKIWKKCFLISHFHRHLIDAHHLPSCSWEENPKHSLETHTPGHHSQCEDEVRVPHNPTPAVQESKLQFLILCPVKGQAHSVIPYPQPQQLDGFCIATWPKFVQGESQGRPGFPRMLSQVLV